MFGSRRHTAASRSKVSIQRATVLFTKYRAEFRLVPVRPRRRPDSYASSALRIWYAPVIIHRILHNRTADLFIKNDVFWLAVSFANTKIHSYVTLL